MAQKKKCFVLFCFNLRLITALLFSHSCASCKGSLPPPRPPPPVLSPPPPHLPSAWGGRAQNPEGMCVGWRPPAATSWGPWKTSHAPPPPSCAAGFKSERAEESAGGCHPHHLLGLPPREMARPWRGYLCCVYLLKSAPDIFFLTRLGCSVPTLRIK